MKIVYSAAGLHIFADGVTAANFAGLMALMHDGQLVRLDNGALAQVKRVTTTAWQTVLIAVEVPTPGATPPMLQRDR